MTSYRGSHIALITISLLTVLSTTLAHPILVECVCNTTLATDAVVSVPAPVAGQPVKFVLPGCIDDVFAETGIRWYINGPYRGGVRYMRKETKPYAVGRAAQRLIALGYRCDATQLYDPDEVLYLT